MDDAELVLESAVHRGLVPASLAAGIPSRHIPVLSLANFAFELRWRELWDYVPQTHLKTSSESTDRPPDVNNISIGFYDKSNKLLVLSSRILPYNLPDSLKEYQPICTETSTHRLHADIHITSSGRKRERESGLCFVNPSASNSGLKLISTFQII